MPYGVILDAKFLYTKNKLNLLDTFAIIEYLSDILCEDIYFYCTSKIQKIKVSKIIDFYNMPAKLLISNDDLYALMNLGTFKFYVAHSKWEDSYRGAVYCTSFKEIQSKELTRVRNDRK